MIKSLIRQLWNDDGGQLIATEFLFFATILIIGLITGLAALRAAINTELTELADAILALNPGYYIGGLTGCCSSTEGSQAIVIPQQIPGPVCTPPTFPQVITIIPCQ